MNTNEMPKEADELTQLRARVNELEEIERHLGGRVEDQRSKIRSLEERMANAAGKVRELARLIREMEANETAWKLKESHITRDNLKQAARIRELEEKLADQVSLTDAFRDSEVGFNEVCGDLKLRIRALEEALPDAEILENFVGAMSNAFGPTADARYLRETVTKIKKVMKK